MPISFFKGQFVFRRETGLNWKEGRGREEGRWREGGVKVEARECGRRVRSVYNLIIRGKMKDRLCTNNKEQSMLNLCQVAVYTLYNLSLNCHNNRDS